MGSRTDEEKKANKVHDRIAKREVKKAVAIAKTNAYERLYQRLKSKESEKEVFKLARARERQTRDLSSVRCIKDEDGRVLIERPMCKRCGKAISISFLMRRSLTSRNVQSKWLERSIIAPGPMVLSPEMRLKRL